jgi:hypothetical protein
MASLPARTMADLSNHFRFIRCQQNRKPTSSAVPDKSLLSFNCAQDGELVEPLPLPENSISTAFRKSRYYAVISTGAMRSIAQRRNLFL